MAETQEKPSVNLVGASFVSQYYRTLTTSPENLFKFYKDNSTFTHGTDTETSEPVKGQTAIKKKISELGLNNCKAKIISADSQTSLNNSVVVLVRGHLTVKGQPLRHFVQIFVLASQSKGYYVLNDIFKYVDLSTTATASAATAPVIEDKEEVASVDSNAATVGTIEASSEEKEYPIADEPVAQEPAPAKSEEKKSKKPKKEAKKQEVKKQVKETSSPAPAPAPAPQAEPIDTKKTVSTKKVPATYASILAGPGYEPPTTLLGEQQKLKELKEQREKKEGKKRERKERPKKTKEGEAPKRERRERKEKGEGKNIKKERKEGGEKRERRPRKEYARGDSTEKEVKPRKPLTTLYVSGLPSNTADSDITSLFLKFGNIVKVINKTEKEKSYAFVVFETPEALKAAVAVGSLKFKGAEIKVEERKSWRRPRKGGKANGFSGPRHNRRGQKTETKPKSE